MDKAELKEFAMYLKNKKYPGIVQDLKLEYNDDRNPPHIYLALIRIKKKYRGMGYGSKILKRIIKFAEKHEIDIRLYATNIYGSDLDRLYQFYMNHGFVLTNKKDGRFLYKYTNILQLA